MKILIAEDDLFFRRMLEQLLLPDYQLQVARRTARAPGLHYSRVMRLRWRFSIG